MIIRFVEEVVGPEGEEIDKGTPRSNANVEAREKLSTAVIDTTVDDRQRLNALSASEYALSSENCLAKGTAKVAANIKAATDTT